MLPPSGVNSLSFSFPFPRVNFPRTSRNFSLTTTTHRHRSCQKRQYLSSQSVRPFLLSDRGGGGGGGGHRKGADLTVRLPQTVSLTDRPTDRSLTHILRTGLPALVARGGSGRANGQRFGHSPVGQSGSGGARSLDAGRMDVDGRKGGDIRKKPTPHTHAQTDSRAARGGREGGRRADGSELRGEKLDLRGRPTKFGC